MLIGRLGRGMAQFAGVDVVIIATALEDLGFVDCRENNLITEKTLIISIGMVFIISPICESCIAGRWQVIARVGMDVGLKMK